MSRHDDRVTVRQMVDHVEEAFRLVSEKGRKREDLDADRMFFLVTLKLVEIVGEAASRVSEPFREAHGEIPWRQIIGTRNRLVHGYDSVDRDILWEIVTADFPAIAPKLKALV
jgi:uncharacterized protein with HEPN domain